MYYMNISVFLCKSDKISMVVPPTKGHPFKSDQISD